jgi:hypothetical protein
MRSALILTFALSDCLGWAETSNYSPIAFSGVVSPDSQSFLNQNSEEAMHYFKLIQKALRRHSPHYHLKLSGGYFSILFRIHPVVQLRDVNEAVHVSNIYHVIKAMEGSLTECFQYLNQYGIPTLVQATKTGTTPPFDAEDYLLEGFNP